MVYHVRLTESMFVCFCIHLVLDSGRWSGSPLLVERIKKPLHLLHQIKKKKLHAHTVLWLMEEQQ